MFTYGLLPRTVHSVSARPNAQLLIQAHENIIAPLGGDLSIKHN